tara:strand:+ start:1842 stop:2204 length:363 start_codon:yes stop_codon:yes gene_type:complete
MINFKHTYYPVNFFLPYFTVFILDFFNLKYVYCYDNIHHYQDNINKINLLPPILTFKIDGKEISGQIKDFKSNIPIIYLLYYCKLLNTNMTEITYWHNGKIENKKIKNIENYNSLNDIFD